MQTETTDSEKPMFGASNRYVSISTLWVWVARWTHILKVITLNYKRVV